MFTTIYFKRNKFPYVVKFHVQYKQKNCVHSLDKGGQTATTPDQCAVNFLWRNTDKTRIFCELINKQFETHKRISKVTDKLTWMDREIWAASDTKVKWSKETQCQAHVSHHFDENLKQ